MTQYIPYSIRNNITNSDLAGLLDYLEREMGWEIGINGNYFHKIIYDPDKRFSIDIWENGKGGNVHFCDDIDESTIFEGMNSQLFFRTYRSILPAIRDLNRKK